MIGLIQRVSCARVEIDKKVTSKINYGILALIGVEKFDTEKSATKLLSRVLEYRIFADNKGKMNLSLSETNGALLLVPQFTLAANTSKGARPSFSSAADSDKGRELFNYLVDQARLRYDKVASGKFATDMKISLTNDGPVTFWLQV